MKKISFILGVLLLLTSCIQKVYQVFTVTPKDDVVVKNGLVYEDDYCSITYNFWCDKGRMFFQLYNKTNEPMYVDMNNTHLLLNNQTIDYKCVRRADMFGNIEFLGENRDIITVQPHTYRVFYEYGLIQNWLDVDDKKISYTESNTLFKFANVISFCIGDSITRHNVCNSFYVSLLESPSARDFKNISVANKDFFSSKYENNKDEKDNLYKHYSPNKFYIVRFE